MIANFKNKTKIPLLVVISNEMTFASGAPGMIVCVRCMKNDMFDGQFNEYN